MTLVDSIYQLIYKTSTDLPMDIDHQLKKYKNDSKTFSIIDETICISRKNGLPICQDTGFPYFYISIPYSKLEAVKVIEDSVSKAIVMATEKGILRPNTVDPIKNKNYGNNLGECLPYIDWNFTDKDDVECFLMLKGGGSENASAQYSLPLDDIQAGRDLKGIINTVLHHLHKIQGQGCSPGILGIGIGGDRPMSMKLAKKQLFRDLNDRNPDPELSHVEQEILERANRLDIGAMGMGGSPTLLGVKAAKAARHPASFFVSISYLCWVARRGKCLLNIP